MAEYVTLSLSMQHAAGPNVYHSNMSTIIYKNIESVSIQMLATQMVDLRATFAAIPTTSPEGLGASQWIPGKNGSIVC